MYSSIALDKSVCKITKCKWCENFYFLQRPHDTLITQVGLAASCCAHLVYDENLGEHNSFISEYKFLGEHNSFISECLFLGGTQLFCK